MHDLPSNSFERAEAENLRAWLKTSISDRIDFFEEMVELAYLSGALRPERLKLRDLPGERSTSTRLQAP